MLLLLHPQVDEDGEGEGGEDSDQEVRKKKRKRRRDKQFALDEEDYMLLEDNQVTVSVICHIRIQ
jgi:hypothetical protein